MKRYLVLGHLGLGTERLDGQIVKTRSIYDLLVKQGLNVSYFDTQDFSANRLSFFRMLRLISKVDVVLYVPAQSNLKWIFPLIFLFSKLRRTEVLYFVVGGWLVEFLQNKPLHRSMLKRIKCIFPETKTMCDGLINSYNINNVKTFPNFRNTTYTPLIRESSDKDTLKLVFMARVNKFKGYDVIFSFVDYAISSNLNVQVDFYGPIAFDDVEDFNTKVNRYSIVAYKGPLRPEEISETLSNYDLLLLPTRYYTEGFPGSIMDAYIAGLPVIVTNWMHSHEFVVDGETGYIVPFDDPQSAFNEKIHLLYNDRVLLNNLKAKSIDFSKRFMAQSALDIIIPYLS